MGQQKTETGGDTPKNERINLPLQYWYEIWSQIIARAWSAQNELSRNGIGESDLEELSKLERKARSERVRALLKTKDINPVLPNGKPADVTWVLELALGGGRKQEITWELLIEQGFVAGEKPLNLPKIFVEQLGDGTDTSTAHFIEKNAFRNINGWAQDLIELGGRAKIKVPPPPSKVEWQARALDWYVKQGFHMPFAPNNRAPFTASQPVTAGVALGFSGNRVGEESSTDALNGDSAWHATFPIILAFAWSAASRPSAKSLSKIGLLPPKPMEKADKDQVAREQDALFAQFGYSRPLGLELEFEVVDGVECDHEGWKPEEKFQPELVVRIPPAPTVEYQAIALADYRATGKSQLFTT